MSLKKLIDVSTLSQLLRKNIINKEGVRLLDCTYSVEEKPDWKKFKKELYGNFKEILARPTPSKDLYLMAHIPQAVYASLDAAMYPSQYERFAHYPHDIFEKYIQMIGVNNGEHIILYSRDDRGGMMYSAKFAWLLKSYGHDQVSILDGGFDAWANKGNEVTTEIVELPAGNWKAKDLVAKFNITFEEMQQKEGGRQYMERTNEINFLDARSRGQFNGIEDTGMDPNRVSGSHIPGFKNVPAAELVDENGCMKSLDDIRELLLLNDYKPGQPVVTNCNTGMQGTMLAFAVNLAYPELFPRVYNGSVREIELRDPRKICAGRTYKPQ